MKPIFAPIFAILTPFQASGKIDLTALDDYLSFLQDKGVKTILTNGTTAEFPSLTFEERMALLEYCRKIFNGVILNNVSACCVGDCVKLINHSENYADALVVLPPYYYANVSESGILAFLAEVLNQSHSPTYLYHFPKHTQNPITLSMVEKLVNDHNNLLGIKYSETDLAASVKFKVLKAGRFQVFVGGDKVVFEVLKSGLDGSVTGGGNAFPELLISITRFFQAGDLEQAEIMQGSLNVWNQFRKQNPLGEIALTKIALRTRLKNFPIWVRAPLQTIESTEFVKEIEGFIQKEISSISVL